MCFLGVLWLSVEWHQRERPRLSKWYRERGRTFAPGQPQTVCHLPHPVPRDLEDVQAGSGLLLDGGGGGFQFYCTKKIQWPA